ncbi:hypothetical protein CVT26_008141 [Gymnopilus dilepis]|uniref:Uncharacterized protein n=1 Tax=Gymnopilus dilepis TaxID=231916 RepID=A0A409W9D5_9AGAR|nr:hypothetical protein CVT26_008141 [Gymnopilus dilepis]
MFREHRAKAGVLAIGAERRRMSNVGAAYNKISMSTRRLAQGVYLDVLGNGIDPPDAACPDPFEEEWRSIRM